MSSIHLLRPLVMPLSLLAPSALSRFGGASQPCYDAFNDGVRGFCEQVDCCSGSRYNVSNLCPDYPTDTKCCFSYNSCAAADGCDAIPCGDKVSELACKLMAMYEARTLDMQPDHDDPRGNDPYDGASALSNVRDACYGHASLRSSYENAPGGCVCLKADILQYMLDYATSYHASTGLPLRITNLAGGSHSVNSWHYEGNTADISCTFPTNHCDKLRDFCLNSEHIQACYPNSICGGHETWVHCALPYDDGRR